MEVWFLSPDGGAAQHHGTMAPLVSISTELYNNYNVDDSLRRRLVFDDSGKRLFQLYMKFALPEWCLMCFDIDAGRVAWNRTLGMPNSFQPLIGNLVYDSRRTPPTIGFVAQQHVDGSIDATDQSNDDDFRYKMFIRHFDSRNGEHLENIQIKGSLRVSEDGYPRMNSTTCSTVLVLQPTDVYLLASIDRRGCMR
jgi:hypothetical protein